MRPPPVPSHVISAVRLLRGPASLLRSVSRALAIAAAVAALMIWVALVGDSVGRFPAGTATSIVAAIVLAVPALWLRHAASTFGDVIQLPARLEVFAEAPEIAIASRAGLRALRTEGPLAAVRTVRATIEEVSDYIGPASTVAEVVAPPFWIWTAAAAAAALLLPLVAVITTVAVLVF